MQICRRKATYLDKDSAKDVSSAEIFIRKREPAICKKGKRTAHSWGVILVILKDGSVLIDNFILFWGGGEGETFES